MPLLLRNVSDERDGLLALLGHLRHALINTSYGLTDDQARATPSASSLSIGGLIKHGRRRHLVPAPDGGRGDPGQRVDAAVATVRVVT